MSDTIFPTQPGRMCEYLLILSPNQEVKDETMRIKRIYKEKYNCWNADRSYPHFTLAYSFLNENEQEEFVGYLDEVALLTNPFLVELHKFERFASSTIYMDVVNKEPITQIAVLVKEKAGQLMKTYQKTKPEFIQNPHLTIATRMRKDQFELAWSEWQSVAIQHHFEAIDMTLLKKPEGGRRYETVKIFTFSKK